MSPVEVKSPRKRSIESISTDERPTFRRKLDFDENQN